MSHSRSELTCGGKAGQTFRAAPDAPERRPEGLHQPRWRLVRAAAVLSVTLLAGCESPARPSPPPPPPPVPPLVLNCPPAVEIESADGQPVPIQFEAPQASGGVAPITTTCSATSGAAFNVGSTTVTCSAVDARGTAATCSFQVTVRAPPRLAYTRFVAFGDSLTAGTLAVTPTLLVEVSPSAYPRMLRNLLQDRYRQQTPTVPTVINEGEPGEQAADGGIRRFRGVLLQHQPEVVLLMEGTNDLLGLSAGADHAIAALELMVREATGQNVRVALATIPPQRPGGVRGRDAVAALIPGFNERIRALAMAARVVLVDVYAAMEGDLSLLGADDLHPTARGYEVIAETFFEAIQANFQVTGNGPSVVR
jgi:lysophospholipase L1-like esterase